MQLLGTGLWDDPRLAAEPGAQGGWFAAPDPAGFRAFSGRYRQRYGQDPVRTATLAYDAVSLVAALVKTQGPARFSERNADQPVGLCRHRRRVPLPPRRHQPARPRGDARHAVRRAGRQPGAEGVRGGRLGDVSDGGRLVAEGRQSSSKSTPPESATTASSTGKPARRHAQAAVGGRLDEALAAQRRDARFGSSGRPASAA